VQLFEDWKEGRTGMPLVDANMRELRCTGFMSNRGRQNVASYLVLDLGIDWRLGADWFEHLLIDHDVTSNWGNWVAAAGLTGGRLNKFNILKQGKDYDENGDYVRTWLPELQKVPKAFVHEPASMPQSLAADIAFQIGRDYPKPVPVSRMARPHGGHRYPDRASTGGHGSPRKGRGQGGQGRGKQRRVPVNMY
jgi:deoxyribodipyrimidine photo-lyase